MESRLEQIRRAVLIPFPAWIITQAFSCGGALRAAGFECALD
jgi:hypothetical protein